MTPRSNAIAPPHAVLRAVLTVLALLILPLWQAPATAAQGVGFSKLEITLKRTDINSSSRTVETITYLPKSNTITQISKSNQVICSGHALGNIYGVNYRYDQSFECHFAHQYPDEKDITSASAWAAISGNRIVLESNSEQQASRKRKAYDLKKTYKMEITINGSTCSAKVIITRSGTLRTLLKYPKVMRLTSTACAVFK